MMSASYRSPHDPLARRNAMPPAVQRSRIAFKLGVGAALGALLAAVASVTDSGTGGGTGPIARGDLAWNGPAPEFRAVPKSPWGEDGD